MELVEIGETDYLITSSEYRKYNGPDKEYTNEPAEHFFIYKFLEGELIKRNKYSESTIGLTSAMFKVVWKNDNYAFGVRKDFCPTIYNFKVPMPKATFFIFDQDGVRYIDNNEIRVFDSQYENYYPEFYFQDSKIHVLSKKITSDEDSDGANFVRSMTTVEW